MLETDFREVLSSFVKNEGLIKKYWQDIVRQHSENSRHYHSIQHLKSVWQQLQPVREKIEDWPVVLFTIVYHDLIYNVQQSNNEEKSAEAAVEQLQAIGLAKDRVDRCYKHIIATKGHGVAEDPDTNYFTDADLSILGSDPDTYRIYAQNIRKEYRIYPSFTYNPGRRKVLQHFLDLPRIFKTDHFYALYEEQARINISGEISSL